LSTVLPDRSLKETMLYLENSAMIVPPAATIGKLDPDLFLRHGVDCCQDRLGTDQQSKRSDAGG
jgi:hypothetical protein